ncbi:MAG: hypothetical protein KF878_26810 [Planctomycetes bacterium]|nr:hypothetical protein [Planctomycetota bacterium]
MTARARVTLGLVVLGAWVVLVVDKALHGLLPEALWCCPMGQLLLGLGLVAAWPGLASAGTAWLAYGVPLWVIGLAAGEVMRPPSWFTHLGAPLIGVVAARGLGVPRGTWWRATLGLVALQAATRLFTPPEFNVNLAHAVYPGWEGLFPTYAAYYLFMLACGAGACLVAEQALRRVVARRPEEEAPCAACPP